MRKGIASTETRVKIEDLQARFGVENVTIEAADMAHFLADHFSHALNPGVNNGDGPVRVAIAHHKFAPHERARVPALQIVDDIDPILLSVQSLLKDEAVFGIGPTHGREDGSFQLHAPPLMGQLEFAFVFDQLNSDRTGTPAGLHQQWESEPSLHSALAQASADK